MGIVAVLDSKPPERSPSVPGDAETTHASQHVALETALGGWPLMASEDALERALDATAPPDMAPGAARRPGHQEMQHAFQAIKLSLIHI